MTKREVMEVGDRRMIQIRLPEDVTFIIEELNKAGYEAYAVGGCVRDALLNKEPEDWDITTSASPYEVKRLFRRTIDTGLQHGTVTVMLHHVGYEVTTYRIDGEYEDGRHPKKVVFTKSLLEDLKRRDFTINAMAYNEKSGIVDEFDGILDLERKIIRCVGNAEERFTEDALRMLRAIRFAAQLGFIIEKKTESSISILAETLKKVSKERIQAELNKLLVSKHPECIKKVYDLGLSLYALPDTERFYKKEVQNKVLLILSFLPSDSILRWAGFLSFCTKANEAERILRGLKFDNHTIMYVSKLIDYLPQEVEPEEVKIRYALYEMGEEIYEFYLILKKAEFMAEEKEQKGKKEKEQEEKEQKEKKQHTQEKKEELKEVEKTRKTERLKKLEETEYLYHKILERGDCISLKTLAVTGKDLIAEGIPAGKEIGKRLNMLLCQVLENPSINKRDLLLAAVKEKMKEKI